MKLGYIGLGKMGGNMVTRLLEKGHEVVVYDRDEELRRAFDHAGAVSAGNLQELVENLEVPRVVWVMVPHEVTKTVLKDVGAFLAPGDIVIDGGNTNFKETIEHAQMLAQREIHFLDVGTSGGPDGARNGACLMIGGEKNIFEKCAPLFKDIAAPDAYMYLGSSGAGHFVKMVHNGIEYGMMQSIADGFELLKASPFNLDLRKVATIYNRRSVVESRLIGWLLDAFDKHGTELQTLSSTVGHTGEGQWTVEIAKEWNVPVPAIDTALEFRKKSSERSSFAGKILSGLRNAFGGHSAEKK